MSAMTGRGEEPDSGPEESRDRARTEDRDARDDLRALVGAAPVDEDEQKDDEILETESPWV